MEPAARFAFALGPPAERLSEPSNITAALEADNCAWAHLEADTSGADAWIDKHLSFLPNPVREALTAAETRPRFVRIGGGVLLNLRGVNLNPGAEPEDMIAVRIWADPARVVSLTRRDLVTIDEIAAELDANEGPEAAGELVARLASGLADRISIATLALEEEGDAIEDALLTGEETGLRARISDLRRDTVDFRRFLLPMRDALSGLLAQAPRGLLTEADRLRIGEAEDALRRTMEVIEALREQLMVLRDELTSKMDERLNRNLYILSVISAVFLPLGFLTGLMGINLAGMPGATWPSAFWVFTGFLSLLLAVILGAFWRLQFFGRRR